MEEGLERGEQSHLVECFKCKTLHVVSDEDCNACIQQGMWTCCEPPAKMYRCDGCTYVICENHSVKLKDSSISCAGEDGVVFCANSIIEKRLGIVRKTEYSKGRLILEGFYCIPT